MLKDFKNDESTFNKGKLDKNKELRLHIIECVYVCGTHALCDFLLSAIFLFLI